MYKIKCIFWVFIYAINRNGSAIVPEEGREGCMWMKTRYNSEGEGRMQINGGTESHHLCWPTVTAKTTDQTEESARIDRSSAAFEHFRGE